MNGWILRAAKRLFGWLLLLKTHVCSCIAVWVRTDEWSERANGWWWTFPVLETGDVCRTSVFLYMRLIPVSVLFWCLLRIWVFPYCKYYKTNTWAMKRWQISARDYFLFCVFCGVVLFSTSCATLCNKFKYVSHERDVIPLKMYH